MVELSPDVWRSILSRVEVADLARLACGSRMLRTLATDEAAGRVQRLKLIPWRPSKPALEPFHVLVIYSNPFWFPGFA